MKDNPALMLRGMMNGFWVSQALYVAAKLGIADRLACEARNADALAAATGANPDALQRLLRVLANHGIVEMSQDGNWRLTEIGECMRSDHPESVHSWTLSMGELGWSPWGELLHCIRTGEPAFGKIYGTSRYAYLQANPELEGWFNHAMSVTAVEIARNVCAAYGERLHGTILDVGGGAATLLAALLQRDRKVRGILLERPEVAAQAQTVIDAAGLSDRCRCVAGDFFESVPSGADICILSFILHNWDDEKALAILRNCLRPLNAGGRILIIEHVLEVPEGEPYASLLDLHMLVMHGGRERTRNEFERLATAAGLRIERITPIFGPCIIECSPI